MKVGFLKMRSQITDVLSVIPSDYSACYLLCLNSTAVAQFALSVSSFHNSLKELLKESNLHVALLG